MGYFAHNDPVYADGFFVEDHDVRNFDSLVMPLRLIVEAEARAGNKVQHTQADPDKLRIHVQLQGPARCDWSVLADGLQHFDSHTNPSYPVYDGDLGAIYDLQSGHGVTFNDPNYELIRDDT